ncbi:MAG: sulfotransferase domain-containing protein [Lentisphaerae bacterium]|nr:sulfotransferase domain-containing protein [Lentisphaerota bacterium]
MTNGPESAGRLPDFLIIGAAKGGTTSLQQYLARHPGLFLSTPKEPEFFSDDTVFARGEAWYRGLFRGAREEQLCGEASTTYTRWPHTADAAGRIAARLPGAKLIYIMRHPVERAYSHYAHRMRRRIAMTFEEALERDAVYVDCSLYMKQIRRYLPRFGRDAFLFLLSSDLRRRTAETLARTQEFLGVAAADLMRGGDIDANRGSSEFYVRSLTTEPLKQLPLVSRLAGALPPAVRGRLFEALRTSPVGRWLDRRYRLPPLRPETRQRLLELFREPNRELAAFLERDLSEWDR